MCILTLASPRSKARQCWSEPEQQCQMIKHDQGSRHAPALVHAQLLAKLWACAQLTQTSMSHIQPCLMLTSPAMVSTLD